MSNNSTHPPLRFDPAALEDMRCRLPEYLTKKGVELTRRGARLVGKCPVHEDNSPSLAIFGTHHENCGCFPCNFQGDVFAVSQWLGRSDSFPSAVRDVAAVLGVHLPDSTAQAATRPATPPQRAAKQVEPPFVLSDVDRAKIHSARLAFSDILHDGGPMLGEIAQSLCLSPEVLRYAAFGESGLGYADRWLCYTYPSGLKWRNPDLQAKPRFVWLVGKATQPWRAEWIRPETETIYLSEGETDCMSLIAAGLEADGSAVCCASPGTSFSPVWAKLFTSKVVVLCFDADPPGQAAALKVAAMLAPFATGVSNWKGGRQ